MLKIKIIVVDRTRSSFLVEGESFYLERLKRYARTEWMETRPAKIKKGSSEAEILKQEGESIIRHLSSGGYIFALDRTGKTYDSRGLARRIERLSHSHSLLCFAIGGALGLSEEVLKNAHERLSLSPLTFTHEMTRLLLLEQLYRAFTIMGGEKYHK